jgi:hypothetical protein
MYVCMQNNRNTDFITQSVFLGYSFMSPLSSIK